MLSKQICIASADGCQEKIFDNKTNPFNITFNIKSNKMKRSIFLLVTAFASFAFGAMMFFIPNFAAGFLAIQATPQTLSVLRGMGGLILGSGAINYFLRNQDNSKVLAALLFTNIITHLLGLSADIWGVIDGTLTIKKMAPVEITHLFVGIGSLIYYLRLKSNS